MNYMVKTSLSEKQNNNNKMLWLKNLCVRFKERENTVTETHRDMLKLVYYHYSQMSSPVLPGPPQFRLFHDHTEQANTRNTLGGYLAGHLALQWPPHGLVYTAGVLQTQKSICYLSTNELCLGLAAYLVSVVCRGERKLLSCGFWCCCLNLWAQSLLCTCAPHGMLSQFFDCPFAFQE